MTDKFDLNAILDRDLHKILDSVDILDSIRNGDVECASCSTVVTENNIGALLVKDHKLLLYCKQIECIEEASGIRGKYHV